MGVVACGRAGTWEGGLNTRRWLERHLMGEKTSELLSGSLSFYLPRAQGLFTDEENCKQISKALELLVVCLLVTCLPTVLVTCPWLFVLLQRATLFVLLQRALSREACFDLVFELGRGEGWVLLGKALGISFCKQNVLYRTMPPARWSEALPTECLSGTLANDSTQWLR